MIAGSSLPLASDPACYVAWPPVVWSLIQVTSVCACKSNVAVGLESGEDEEPADGHSLTAPRKLVPDVSE